MTQKLNEQILFLKNEIGKRDQLLDESELAELEFDEEECDLEGSLEEDIDNGNQFEPGISPVNNDANARFEPGISPVNANANNSPLRVVETNDSLILPTKIADRTHLYDIKTIINQMDQKIPQTPKDMVNLLSGPTSDKTES